MSSSLLRFVYDYRSILGRRDILRLPLDPEECGQLVRLEQRFLWNAQARAISAVPALRRRYLRLRVALSGHVKVGAAFHDVTIVDLGGGGLQVTPAPDVAVGEVSVVKIADPAIGREYHLPVQVMWTAAHRMGLAFFGIPIELRYGGGRAGLADDAAA